MVHAETRRLAAIMFTDIVGFSRQMGSNEARMLRLLEIHNYVIQQAVTEHHGTVIKLMGDAFLVDFPSVVHAVQCAQGIQAQFHTHNAEKETAEQIHVRIGIHLGDVVQKDGDVFGDGVNIAARLQELAEPDTICLSDVVYRDVAQKISVGTVISLGRPKLKNIAQRFPVYALLSESPKGFRQTLRSQRLKLSRRVRPAHRAVMAGLLLIAGILVAVRYFSRPPLSPQDSALRTAAAPAAQLIDATTGYHLWSERYDRPLQDIFALQDEIVQKIVTTLKLQLTLQGQGYIVHKHTDNLEAYDAFLRGMEPFFRYTKEANIQARQMFENAIALDSQYAQAYAQLGFTYWLEWGLHWSADPQTLERALALAQQAVALDDSLPVAHSVLSNVYALQQQYDRAIAEGERAIALDLNDDGSYAGQAQALNLAGRPEEALRAVEQAMRLNPRYPPWYLMELGWAYRLTGRYAEAITTLKDAISRSPDFLPAHQNLALSYVQQWISQQSADAQTLAQAVAATQRIIALNDSYPLGHVRLGIVYLWQKQYELAIAEIERAIALDPNLADGSVFLADTLSRVSRSEDALEAATQALRLQSFIADWHLDSIGTTYYLTGRPKEAIAPLKQYLTRYPNILGAHLTLAAVYSELGKEIEARAEAAEVLRINPQFSLEVHKQRVPIKDPAMLEWHLAALRTAGLK